jgi:hypothetical protein
MASLVRWAGSIDLTGFLSFSIVVTGLSVRTLQ